MPHRTSRSITERIEALYGRPRAELEAHADATGHASMLAALLGSLSAVEFAERDIAFQAERLRQLTHPDREIGRFTAGHLLDCARRIGEAVAVRDSQAQHTSAVLQSLHRAPAPAEQAPAMPGLPAAAPAAPAARAR
ncbi:hypothetical protein ACFYUL_19210 [Streptomyces sp. NPDC004311]|uniref:hypothetical protein n=1 Tax=Streptomyces sp. NPDC004311 TaxID=3364698 RepID=UPI0036CB673C